MQPFEAVPTSGSTPAAELGAALPPRVLSGAGVVALRSALQAQLRGEWPDGALRRAIRVMCDEAHRNGLRAEQLLVILKDAWSSLPEVARLPTGGTRERLLDRIVTMCVEEFYGSHDTPA
jgi:hypothetical protein